MFACSFAVCNIATAATASPWKFDFSGAKGIALSYQGIPIIYYSSLYVVKPGWKGLLYDQRENKTSIQKQPDGSIHISDTNKIFSAKYDLRILDAQTAEIHFQGELIKDVPAQIDLGIGYFNANLIVNRPFRAIIDDPNKSTFNGIVPSYPKQDGLGVNKLVPSFRELIFDSRLGKLSITSDATLPTMFMDARRNYTGWSQLAPAFWVGWPAGMSQLHFSQPVELTLRISINTPTKTVPQSAVLHNVATPTSNAYAKMDPPKQVVPQPKQMQLQPEKYFSFSDKTQWSVTAPAGEARLTQAAKRQLGKEWNLDLSAPHLHKSTFKEWSGIRIGSNKPISFPASVTKADWAQHSDSYQLIIDEHGIQIIAPSARGAFYGLQTLAQLQYIRNQQIVVSFATITDWPTLQFRGVHWFPSQSGVAFDKKIIRTMARYKVNYSVIQCGSTRWDSHPEIAMPNSISKKDLQELVDLCRANFIEPIPLINGPGHASWMFRNKQNAELAEDPQKPHQYAVNNPKTMQFVHDVMSEAIAIFHPEYFHIGGDEVMIGGRFPNPDNPYNPTDSTLTSLLLKNIKVQRDWLTKRSIKTIIWGDMFTSEDGVIGNGHAKTVGIARTSRANIPKDVVVADWQYGYHDEKEYPSLKLFQDDDLKVIAASWYKPLNIYRFTHEAIKINALGSLQTTWAGYFPDETILNTQSQQFNAYILAADYSWSGRMELPKDLPYSAATLWDKSYDAFDFDNALRSGTLINLQEAARVQLGKTMNLGDGRNLEDFFAEQKDAPNSHLGKVLFHIPNNHLTVISNAPATLAPQGSLHKLTIDTNRKASEIAFLHASLWGVLDGTKVAQCTVRYADGTYTKIDLTTGYNTGSWQDDSIVGTATRIWEGKTSNSSPLSLYLYRWENPYPDKVITRLILQPLDEQAGYVLAGLTLIE